jgi:hypothetical protein
VIKLDSCWINQWMDGYIIHSKKLKWGDAFRLRLFRWDIQNRRNKTRALTGG